MTNTTTDRGGPVIGIDLGTTYSLVATLEAGEARLIPNALGELMTPSAVAVRGDETLVGAPARDRAVTRPREAVFSFKRDMGTDKIYTLAGRRIDPVTASAHVLGSLKKDAEAYLGRPVDAAVITVPAYFNDLQRRATHDAATIAGLRVERLINEPTAAAISYGVHQRHREVRVVVLDLGGGTFDVTVLEILEGVLEVQSSAGDSRLGGDDFSAALVDVAVEEILGKEGGSAAIGDWPAGTVRAHLFEAAEAAKKRLSGNDEARIVLPELVHPSGHRADLDVPVSRERAEEAWAPLLSRMEVAARRALHDAGLTPAAVDEVLLVGGASRMPCVVRMAARLFGTMPVRNQEPDFVVARGAALQAGLHMEDEAVEDLVVTDVAPFSLGVASGERVRGVLVTDLFTPLLDRGTVIPASREGGFSTLSDGQTEIRLEVYQGEHALVRDNRKLGELVISGLRPAPAGEETLSVRFTYDLNGLLEVEAKVDSTGEIRHLVLEESPGSLTPDEISRAREAMKQLKVHPRDTLPNLAAMERGEALYTQLVGPARVELGAYLAGFRAALESQDPRQIEEGREILLAVISRLR